MGNEETQAWLTRRLVEFRTESVSVDDIDWPDRQLQNRTDVEMSETVEVYRAGYERGDRFPWPVLWEPEPGHYIPIDGYTRAEAAHKARVERLDCFIVTCPEQLARDLAAEVNAHHGALPSVEHRVETGLLLIAKGVTLKDAAARLNLPEGRLSDAKQLRDADDRAKGLDIVGWERLHPRIRKEAYQLRNGKSMKAFAELARDANWTVTEAGRRRADLRPMLGEEDELRMIDRWRVDEVRSRSSVDPLRKGRSRVLSDVSQLLAAASRIKGMSAERVAKAADSTDERLRVQEAAHATVRWFEDLLRCLDA